MSEKKEDWKAEIAKIIDTRLEAWKPPTAISPPSLPKIEEVNDKHVTHSLEDLLSCPDCYPKLKKAVLDKEILSRKDLELECKDCGTGVNESEESCPTCGGKDATHRHR